MNLKSILDEVMLLSGMDTETVYATATEDAVKRLVSIANQSAATFAQYPWQALRSRYEFTMSTATTEELPDDYRAIIPDTMFVNGQAWTVDFPTDTIEWSYLVSATGGAGIRRKMRLLDGEIHIYQPTSGDTVSFEYLSIYPVLNSVGTAKQRFTADTDTWRLDDDLIIKDVLWRYKKLIGHTDWQIDLAGYKAYELAAKGHDKGAQTIVPGDAYGFTGEPYYELWRSA